MRKLLVAVVFLLGLGFATTHLSELQKMTHTLLTGDWRFVLLAVLIEVLWLWVLGKTYQSIYRILGMDEDNNHLLSVAAAANFVSVIAPSGGMSAVAMFLSDGIKRGLSAGRVTVANAIFLLCEYIALLAALSAGFVVLVRRNNLHWPEILAGAVILAGVVVLVALLFLAMRSARSLGSALAFGFRLTNKAVHPFIRRDYLQVEQAHYFAYEASTAIRLLRRSSAPQLIRPFLFSFSNKLLMIAILILVFMAFGVPYTAGTIVAGFSLGYLFVVVSPTPAGLGIVEGVLTLSLRSLGVPLEPAAVITLAFRGVTFWEPLFIGGYMFKRVNSTKETNIKEIN